MNNKDIKKDKTDNKMREIKIEKVTFNISTIDQAKLDKAMKFLEKITNAKPVKTYGKRRVPNWGVRPGLPIGVKVTIRGKKAEELLKKMLEGKDFKLKESSFTDYGVSFGFNEYIEVPTLKYDPEIGILGFEIAVTLERPGFRVKKRKIKKSKIGKKHLISKDDAIKFFKEKFNVEVI